MARPTLHLIAGPNGAGKTTFYDTWLRPRTEAAYINPDLLARDALGHWAVTRAEAQLGQALAAEHRETLLAAGDSLVLETTFSHPSKLDMVAAFRTAGYRLALYHLGLADAEVAVERVLDRQAQGGHPVPETQIRGRYARNGPLIRQAVLEADFGYVFDNSVDGRPPLLLASFVSGQCARHVSRLPPWAAPLYGPAFRARRPPNA